MSKIFVVGSGSFGTAIAVALAQKQHRVVLWSRRAEMTEELRKTHQNPKYLPNIIIPETVEFANTFQEVKGSDLIVIAVPSNTVKETCQKLAPFVSDGQIIVSISKGFDLDTYQRLSEVISEQIPNCTVCAMSGPSHAEEVAIGMPTTNVVACEQIEVAKFVQDIFTSNTFRIYSSNDVIGVEIGGALKNIIALCAGVSDGMGYGDNAKAAIMTRGMAEILRFGMAMGAKFETFMGLSGFGDLIVTCTSMHSRNRRAGILIGQGKSAKEAIEEVGMVVEGIYATKCTYELAKKYNIDMPIVTEAYNVIFNNEPVSECTAKLMGRPVKNETETYIVSK